MKHSLSARMLAASVSASLIATPVSAKSADSLQDLVGIRASAGESALQARGFEFAKAGDDTADSRSTYWWNRSRDDCIMVRTADGRYVEIRNSSDSDCSKGSGGSGGAIAAGVIGAAVLGAILLSRKDRNKPTDGGYQHDWQQVEVYNLQSGSMRIFDSPSTNARVRAQVRAGTILRNYGCDQYGGESWCEVATINGRTTGWARDRYLRPAYGEDQYPGWGNERMVEVYGVSDALTILHSPSKNDYTVGRVSAGTRLRQFECRRSGGEEWCRVSTIDRRLHGWARARYLRATY